ncbi:unnamed protein product [Calypogeia fissa]
MGGSVASVGAIRVMSIWCGNPLPSKSVLLRFSAGGFRGREGLRFSSFGRENCASWGVVEKGKEQGNRLNWTWRQPSCALDSSGRVGGNDGGARKELRMPVLDKDENGNIFLRQFSGDENLQPRENGSPSSSKPSSRPAGKSNVVRGKESVNGNSSSARPLSSVKVNLPSADPRARRLASAKGAASNRSNHGSPLYSKAARRFYNERFREEPQRLSKVLAAAGVASRRGCEEVIFDGRVSVNGDVCKVPQTPVDPVKDIIYVDGRSLPKKMAPKLYFALNKPKGYICSVGEEGTKPVLSFFDDYLKVWAQRNPGLAKPRMFTVGRLDVATSGLLLVTNDGDFAQKVSHPSAGLTKEYVATVNERVTRRQLQTIANGTMVQGVKCVPKEVEILDVESGEERQRLRIVVGEGRNHEVRVLVENSGLQVLALKRTRIGGLRLSRRLGIGKFETLSSSQIAEVLKKDV